MVAAKRITGGSGRVAVGKGLLILGGLFLAAQAALVSWNLSQYWNHAGSGLDALSSVGLALVHAVNTVAWNPAAALATAISVLVSCWPLLLIVTGIVLLRRPIANGAKRR